MDQPMTFKTHEQRTARIHRLGQLNDVEVVNMLANHDFDRRARDRVRRTEVLAGIYQGKEGYLDDSGLAETLRKVRARHYQHLQEAA
jgi:SNF2 family DNA or RNA helicase